MFCTDYIKPLHYCTELARLVHNFKTHTHTGLRGAHLLTLVHSDQILLTLMTSADLLGVQCIVHSLKTIMHCTSSSTVLHQSRQCGIAINKHQLAIVQLQCIQCIHMRVAVVSKLQLLLLQAICCKAVGLSRAERYAVVVKTAVLAHSFAPAQS
jgi:hypothetical protein